MLSRGTASSRKALAAGDAAASLHASARLTRFRSDPRWEAGAHRELGVGRAMRFAERTTRAAGCVSMQLEVLVPRVWTHPVTAFLAASYTRGGYALIRTGRIDAADPALAPLLAAPCDFQIDAKDLGRNPGMP